MTDPAPPESSQTPPHPNDGPGDGVRPAPGGDAPSQTPADRDGALVLDETPAARRADALDALSAILPPERRERMADILTDADVATLRHLAKQGVGPNTLRAIASDLHYLETWSLAALGAPLPWPASEALVLKFLAHHLYDPTERERDGGHGMPADVAALLRADGCLRCEGPHAPATVSRRLAHWATLHRWRGFLGPFTDPGVRAAKRLAARATQRPRGRKSQHAVTRDILDRLLATCDRPLSDAASFVDARDRAILLVAFASGGRRRSEIARLRTTDISPREPVPGPDGAALPCSAIKLGRTKTGNEGDDEHVLIIGRPVIALEHWIALAGIRKGAVFRAIDRFGRLAAKALDGQSINAVLKKRCAMAGLDPKTFSAHGLRSGYLTEAARRGIPLQQAMQQSRHKSVQQAANYYNEVEIERSDAARLG